MMTTGWRTLIEGLLRGMHCLLSHLSITQAHKVHAVPNPILQTRKGSLGKVQ